MNWQEVISIIYQNENFTPYLIALIIFLAVFTIIHQVKKIVLKKIDKLKPSEQLTNIIKKTAELIRPLFYGLIAFRLAFGGFLPPGIWLKAIDWILIAWATVLAIIFTQFLIDYLLEKKIASEDLHTKAAIRLVGKILKILVWIVAAMFALSNMGVDITSAMAGLGIGGIAVALAAQNILGDLFSSFSIYLDKPFVVGDFIIVGNKMGTVEKIGIKTTRVRALQGEELVFSNNELVSTQIQNFKKMTERRVVFHLGVTYETPNEKLEKIPLIIRDITEGLDLVRLDRVHFQEFGPYSLNYEIVYLVTSADYNDFMDTQEKINLTLKEKFEDEGINFAYPTSNILLKK